MSLPRLTRSDVAIGLSIVLLVWALLAPLLGARRFDILVDQATADVDSLHSVALRLRATEGRWPEAAPRGSAPEGMAAFFPGDSALVREGYSLQWLRLSVVEEEEATPPVPTGTGPAGAAPDVRPDALGALASGELRLDSVAPQRVTVVRSVGAIVLRSANESLLAELLARYGSSISFVRDSAWTLVVDQTSRP